MKNFLSVISAVVLMFAATSTLLANEANMHKKEQKKMHANKKSMQKKSEHSKALEPPKETEAEKRARRERLQ